MLVEQIRADITAAMKDRDQVTLGALRLALAALMEASVAGDESRELSDGEAIAVLTKAARKHVEAAEAFEGAGRADSATAERASHAVVARYLPTGLDDAELAAIVARVLADGGFCNPKDMGAAMKAVNAEVAGRADGKVVAGLVKDALAG